MSQGKGSIMTDWTYGSELCATPNIPLEDWVYGDEVCTTLPTDDVVYPTDSRVRVTSLVHRWSPGLYQLEINLGELTAEFEIPDVIRQPRTKTDIEPVEPQPDKNHCALLGHWFAPGSKACVNDNCNGPGSNLAVCAGGKWKIIARDSPTCTGVF